MDFEFLELPMKMSSLDPIQYQYFKQLLQNRTIVFNTDIDENIIETVYLPLKDFEEDDSTTPVTLILNSCGGSVHDSLFLAYYLSTYKKKLNVIVTGYAASMAAIILAGGGNNPNVHRVCYPSSYALIHDGYVSITTSESKSASDVMMFNELVDQQIRQFMIDHTKITSESYDNHARHQWFLTAEQMKEVGLVDEILGSDK